MSEVELGGSAGRIRAGRRVVSAVLGWGLLVGGVVGCGEAPPPPPPTRRVASGSAAAPNAVPVAWSSVIGEYERAGHHLSLLERSEALRIRVDSGPARAVAFAGADSLVVLDGAAVGDRFAIARAEDGGVTGLVDANGAWTRRSIGSGTFRITPLHTAASLRARALAATPPAPAPDLLPADLVEITDLDSTIRLDIRYATTNNFMGERFYDAPRALLQRPAAEALVRAQHRLHALGYGLLIHDAYRPWSVTWMFWEATPDSQKIFVADPAAGSRHNRGAAVDLTLYDLTTGEPVRMPSGYDEFSERAYPNYTGGTVRERWHRDLLRAVLEAEGFHVYQYEWWHFDYDGWERYPILNVGFDSLRR